MSKEASQRYRDKGSATVRKTIRQISTTMVLNLIKEEIGCMKCKRKDIPAYGIDTHHIIPKEHNISQCMNMGTMDTMLYEIQKCILLCAICHREVHYANNRAGIF